MRTYRTLLTMTLYQFRSLFRNKVALFFNIMLPLAMLAVFGAIYAPKDGPTTYTIGFVDKDNGPVSQQLRQAIDAAGTFDLRTGDEADLRSQLEKGKIRTLVILPEGLSAQAANGPAPGMITLLYEQTSTAAGPAIASLQAIIGRMGMSMNGNRPVLVPDAQPITTAASFTVFEYMLPGQIAYALLSAGLMTVALGMATQRQNGSMRHLFSTPLSVGAWTASRLIANIFAALLQSVVLYGSAMAMFHVHLPANLFGTLVLLVLGALMTVGLGMAVGSLTRGSDQAFPLAMSSYMIMAFLGGAMMPLENAPAVVTNLSKAIPVTYLTHSLKLVMMQGKSLGDVGLDLVVLAGTALVLILVAMWRMRRQFISA